MIFIDQTGSDDFEVKIFKNNPASLLSALFPNIRQANLCFILLGSDHPLPHRVFLHSIRPIQPRLRLSSFLNTANTDHLFRSKTY